MTKMASKRISIGRNRDGGNGGQTALVVLICSGIACYHIAGENSNVAIA